MNFKYKCILQNVFSKIPKGEILNYFFQKFVTHTLPVSKDSFLNKVGLSHAHYLKFCDYNSLKENSQKYYEFGAGWDLISPISMGLLGFEVSCIDIRKLVFNKLIADTITKFNNNVEYIPFSIKRMDLKYDQNALEYLKNNFYFNYIAPLDASNTKFDSDYFDFATSTATCEHIPEHYIYLILNETYRILKPGGILSLIIDYKDHWSYFDKDISIYNFLKYSDKEWKKYNPSLHYQNRLRHKEYLNLINKTDFQIMEDMAVLPTEEEITVLKNMTVDAKYKNYSITELSIKSSHIVLKK